MRITQKEKRVFIETVKGIDAKAKIFLFGSRTDDTKKGGDFDIIVQSNTLSDKDGVKLQSEFFKRMEERKIDLVFTKNFSEYLFIKTIQASCLELKN